MRIRGLMFAVAGLYVMLSGASCPSTEPPSADSGDPVRDPSEFVTSLLTRLPQTPFDAVDIIDPAASPPGALIGMRYDGGYSMYFRGDLDGITGLLVADAAGALLEIQPTDDSDRVVFATGDGFTVTEVEDGALLTFELAATSPPSRITFHIGLDEEVVLDEAASVLNLDADPTYGQDKLSAAARRYAAKPAAENRTCELIAEIITDGIERACKRFSTKELLRTGFGKACEKVHKFVDDHKDLFPEALYNRLTNAIGLTCVGGEIAIRRGGFFTKFSALDYACFTYDIAQQVAQVVRGKSLEEIICEQLTAPTPTPTPSPSPSPSPSPTPTPTPTPSPSPTPTPTPIPCPEGLVPDAAGHCCPEGRFFSPTACEEHPDDCCETCEEGLNGLHGIERTIETEVNILAGAYANCRLLGIGCESIAALEAQSVATRGEWTTLVYLLYVNGCLGDLPDEP